MTAYLLITFIIFSIILWAWACYDIHKTEFPDKNTGILMLLVVLISPVLGAIIYFQIKPQLAGKKEKRIFNPFQKD